MNYLINEDILIKFIVGETRVEENARVEKWITESLENENKYKNIKTLWKTSK